MVREAETWSTQNPNPGMATHKREEPHKSRASLWGARGVCPTSGTSTLGTCSGKISPQNVWLWKPTGLRSTRSKGLPGTEVLLLKGSTDSLQGWAQKQPFEEHLCMKEIHLLILKQLLEGQGWLGLSPGMEVLAGIIFVLSTLIGLVNALQRSTLLLPWKSQWVCPGLARSLRPVKARGHALVACSPTVPLKPIGTCSLHGMLLVARGTCIPGSHGAVAIGKTVLGCLLPPVTAQTADETPPTPSFCRKGLHTHRGASACGFQVWHTSKDLQRCSQGM